VAIFRTLVFAPADDPRKPQRETAFVTGALLNAIKRDLDHYLRPYEHDPSKLLNGGAPENPRELANLNVGQPRVRLADVDKAFAGTDTKRIVRKHRRALAIALFGRC